MSGGITPISKEAVTPRILLENVAKVVDEFDEIYIVAVTRSGQTQVGAVGPIQGMCFAAAVLTQSALSSGNMRDHTEDLIR